MPSVLVGAKAPGEKELAAVLGRSAKAWAEIVAALSEQGIAGEWKSYGAKHGWQWKAAQGKRSVLYLIPGEGSFTAALALKGAALKALASSGLPASLVSEIESAKEYSEGKPARVVVRSASEVKIVRRLVELKIGG